MPGVQQFISKEQSQRFIEPPPFDMKQCFADSKCYTPLIFVLTPGKDRPKENLLILCFHLLNKQHSDWQFFTSLQYLLLILSSIMLPKIPGRVKVRTGILGSIIEDNIRNKYCSGVKNCLNCAAYLINENII